MKKHLTLVAGIGILAVAGFAQTPTTEQGRTPAGSSPSTQDPTTPTTRGNTPSGRDATGSQSGRTPGSMQTGQDTMSADRAAGKGSSGKLMGSDQTFATKAAIGGLAEVQLGNLAKEKASSAEVKNFGQQMVDDHSKANDELKSLLTSKGVTVPTSLDSKHQALYDRLSKLSGAEFDRAYMKEMVSDHKTDVDEFRKESQKGSDAELKGFAAKTLPTLEHHLQMAQTTEASVRGGKGASSNSSDRSMDNMGHDATGSSPAGNSSGSSNSTDKNGSKR